MITEPGGEPPESDPDRCSEPHPIIRGMRCELDPDHDGLHHAENVWWLS
jgi:hypothetical protein